MAKTRLEIVLSGQVQRFNDALREAQRVGAEALTAIGAEAKKASDALEETGESAKEAGDGLEETGESAKEAGDGLEETAKSSKRASESLGQTGESAKKAGSDLGEISQAAQIAGAALGGIALAGAAITKSFLSEANQMQKYEATLKALTGSTEEARIELEKYLKFAADAPAFDLKGVMDGALKMKALEVNVERFLPLAGDLAAVFDRSLPDAALALAKALSGSQDGLTQLADAFGVTKKELIQFGAATKGDVIDVKQIDKLQAAIEKVVSQKYGGVMMEQAAMANGAFATLEDAISRLKAAFGKEIIDDFASLAKALTGVLEHIEKWPGPTKAMVAQAVVVATAIGGIGLAASGVVMALRPLTTAIKMVAATRAAAAAAAATAAAAEAAALTTSGMAMAANEAAAIGLAGGTTSAATGMGALATASTAATLSLGAALGIVGAAALVVAGLVHWYGKTVEASEAVRVEQQKVADRFRESRDSIVEASKALKEFNGDVEKAGAATADAFRDAGKDDLDAAKAILALVEQRNAVQERLADAREKVADLRAKSRGGAFSKQFYAAELAEAEKYEAAQQSVLDRVVQRIEVQYQVRERMSGTHAAKVESEKRAEQAKADAIDRAAKALEDYNQKASAGFYATKKDQLAALDSLLAGMNKSDAEYKKLSLSRVKLAREVGEEETKAAEESRKKNVEAAMWELDKLKALGNDNFQQRKAALAKILAEEFLNTEERKKLELELLEVERTIGDHKVAIAKKAAEKKLKAEQDAAKLRVDAAKTDRAEADQELDILKEKLELGQDVTEQLKEQLQTRQKMAEEEIKAASEADKIGKSAAEKASIDKQAQSAITMSRKDTARESDAIERKSDEKRKKATLEALKLEEQLADAKFKSDKKVTQGDLNAHYKERLRISEEQLRLQAEIDAATAIPEEKARIQNQLELDLYSLRKKSTEELAAASEELDKAKKKAEDLNKATFKGVQTLDDMIKDMSNLGGIRRRGANKAEGEEGVSDKDRNRAAGSLGVNPNEKVPEGPDYKTASERKGTKQSGGGSGNSGGMGVSKWDRERAEADAEKNGGKAASGGGDVSSALLEGFQMLDAAIQRFHADMLAAASKGGGTRVEIVTPQGQRSDGWTYTSQQT